VDERQAALATWVGEVVGQVVALRRRPGGGSHQAWDVLADGEARWFLRTDGADPGDDNHYTLRREAEIYRAVHRIGLPSPAVIAIHPTMSAVVLERSSGEAAFARLDVDAQTAVIDDMARWLARLHAADVREFDLPSVLPAATMRDAVINELDLWEARLDGSGVADPALTACFQWLRDHVPDTGDAPPSLVQGDAGPGNFLHDGTAVTAFLDFELGHLGDPMEDLAWVGTRNAQEPVPDYERFLRRYAEAAGVEPDRNRIRYHALFAELRIACLGTERLGGEPDLDAEFGNRLIYGALHRRLTVEALAAVLGVAMPTVDLPESGDTPDTLLFDAMLHQMHHRVGPQIDDPWASRLLKGMARVTKYLREVDRSGGRHREAELDDLEALLGHRPATPDAGAAELLERVRRRELSARDLLPYAAGQVARRTQLVGPAMGRLANSHLPPI